MPCFKTFREIHPCSSISNDEIARARPDMNIKVAAYVKA